MITIKGKIWLYPGEAAWYFISIPKSTSAKIDRQYGHLKRGWGSLRVKAMVGDTSWGTSIFPDKKSGTYLLPLKKEVRKAEGLTENNRIELKLIIVDN